MNHTTSNLNYKRSTYMSSKMAVVNDNNLLQVIVAKKKLRKCFKLIRSGNILILRTAPTSVTVS